eukprot:9291144-Pyramimonas_sp.AAC.1
MGLLHVHACVASLACGSHSAPTAPSYPSSDPAGNTAIRNNVTVVDSEPSDDNHICATLAMQMH